MDEIVRKALAKWPDVPHCFGWLALDLRGRWWMRDDRAKAAGGFASGAPGARGSLLEHVRLVEFIGRNYAADEAGQWYFQNGPQRVYVELEAAPWVWRIDCDLAVQSHTGQRATVRHALTDTEGRVYLVTDHGLGLVHTLDVERAAEAIDAGHWALHDAMPADLLPQRYGFVRVPGPLSKE